MTRETFLKWANRLPKTAMHMNMILNLVWIVPALSCAMGYMNEERYGPENDAPKVEQSRKKRRKTLRSIKVSPRPVRHPSGHTSY